MLFSYAVIIPMANEENDFESFVSILKDELDRIGSGSVYFIVYILVFIFILAIVIRRLFRVSYFIDSS